MKIRSSHLLALLLALALTVIAGCSQTPPATPVEETSMPGQDSHYPVTITNATASGQSVEYTYRQPPHRVVITHPGATELLLELGLEDRILTTVDPYGAPLSHLAPAYAKLPRIHGYVPSLEELIELQPDLIIGWPHHFTDTALGTVESWHERGIATLIVPGSLSKTKLTLNNTVYAFLNDIGKIFGVQEKTDRYIQDYQNRIAGIEQSVCQVARKKTVLVLQDHFNGRYTLYDSSYLISLMIETAGGIHIGNTLTSPVSAEGVLAFDPDFILLVSYNLQDGARDLTDQQANSLLLANEELRSLRAIRQGNIISLPFFTVNNGGIRTIDAIEKIAHQLYPEQFQ